MNVLNFNNQKAPHPSPKVESIKKTFSVEGYPGLVSWQNIHAETRLIIPFLTRELELLCILK